MRKAFLALGVVTVLTVVAIAIVGATAKPPAPYVELSGPPNAPELRHICSVSGDEAILYTTSSGEELDPIPTGERCNYDQWRRERDAFDQHYRDMR